MSHQVITQDWTLANQIADQIVLGKAFAFVGREVFDQPSLVWVKRFFGESVIRSQVLSLMGPDTVVLPSVSIQPITIPKLKLANITSDKALYREKKDPVNLLILDPLSPDTDVVVILYANGAELSKHTVHFNSGGAATLILRDLLSGSYEVKFKDFTDKDPTCAFTVAEYRLASLVASLVDRRLVGEKLTVKIRLEAFGVALSGPVKLDLMDRNQRLASNKADSVDGIVETTFNLSGQGPHSINIQLVNDPARTATVPIVGSRESERKQTPFSYLGTTVRGTLLPNENSREVRGIFLEEGTQVTSPFRLEKVDTNRARLIANTTVESACVVIVDHTFPSARNGAVNPSTAAHPATTDEIYRFGEKLFAEHKFSQARIMFEEKRATLTNPHPNYAYYLACCYAREGNQKQALMALRTAIEDGWNDFNHMMNDDDLASLRGLSGYEMLKTGGRQQLNFPVLRAGEVIEMDVPAPTAILAIGAYVEGKPWEGWGALVSPTSLKPEIKLPETCRPGSEINIEINLGEDKTSALYLIVKDARLLSSDTPTSRLAGQIKDLVEKSSKDLMFGNPQTKLRQFLSPPEPPTYYKSSYMPAMPSVARSASITGALPPPVPMMMESIPMPRPASAPAGGFAMLDAVSSMLDDVFLESEESGGKGSLKKRTSKKEESNEADNNTKPTIVEDPEVLFAGLVDVKGGIASVNVKLGDAFADYVVEAFAISGLDWARVETRFRAEKEVFAVLDVPLFVYKADTAIGRVHLGSKSGQIRVKVTCDRKPIQLIYDGHPIEQNELINAAQAEVSFLVTPGDYEVMIEDPITNRVDYVVKRVNEPGKFQYLAKTLCFLREGEKLYLESDPTIVALRVMPSLDKPFQALVDATSNYGHACCEQTAAIMLSACAMYTFSGDDKKRRDQAESIIIAGVKREESMWLKGRGFKMYPDYANEPHSYYGPKAARYLWNLSLLKDVGRPSPSLAQAIENGLMMAKDATAAYKLDWPPKNPNNCEEAYGAVRFGNNAQDQALRIARKYADNQQPASNDPYLMGAVGMRAEAAYAAATLFRVGTTADYVAALALANKVVKDLGENGRLYSTVDSVAAIALMSELQAAKIVSGTGKLEVNGQATTAKEAINTTEKIISIAALQGVIPVEVTRVVTEDWGQFSNGIQLRITLEKDGKFQPKVNIGDGLDLKVKLEGGYKVGDVLWVCLPEALSRVIGGGQVKKFSLDFAGKNELTVPLAATSMTVNREGEVSPQHFAVCVRNMFEEERTGSSDMLQVTVTPPSGSGGNSIFGRALGAFRNLFNKT